MAKRGETNQSRKTNRNVTIPKALDEWVLARIGKDFGSYSEVVTTALREMKFREENGLCSLSDRRKQGLG